MAHTLIWYNFKLIPFAIPDKNGLDRQTDGQLSDPKWFFFPVEVWNPKNKSYYKNVHTKVRDTKIMSL